MSCEKATNVSHVRDVVDIDRCNLMGGLMAASHETTGYTDNQSRGNLSHFSPDTQNPNNSLSLPASGSILKRKKIVSRTIG